MKNIAKCIASSRTKQIFSTGNRRKYCGNRPKPQIGTLELGLMKLKKLGLIPQCSDEVPSAHYMLGLIPYPAGALGLSP